MDVRLSKLSENFYEDYPHEIYPEILEKQNRPYFCITFFDERGFYICIPYRSYISHPNDAYFFDFSRRYPRRRRVLPCSGLDYTKIVIIQKEEYISDEQVVINTQQSKIFSGSCHSLRPRSTVELIYQILRLTLRIDRKSVV